MKPPSIAVIVPNRNHAAFVPRCLRSLLDQTVPPDEIIFVDDQSSDDSAAVVQALIQGHDSAQLVVNPMNLGTNGALNEGLKRTRSDYVLFLASNDFVLPGIFERAKDVLARAPGAGLWSAMAWLVDEDDKPMRLHPSAVISLTDSYFTPQQCIRLAYRFGNWFTGTSAMYHRDTLGQVGGFNPDYGAPADLFAALTIASLKGAAFTPAALCAIRLHENSYSSRALQDPAGLEAMVERLRVHGRQLSPRLYTDAFIDRTAKRFRFAAVRAAAGDVHGVTPYTRGLVRKLLSLIDRVIPVSWHKTRVILTFLILRPFDVVPTIFNRLLAWPVIRLRSKAPPYNHT